MEKRYFHTDMSYDIFIIGTLTVENNERDRYTDPKEKCSPPGAISSTPERHLRRARARRVIRRDTVTEWRPGVDKKTILLSLRAYDKKLLYDLYSCVVFRTYVWFFKCFFFFFIHRYSWCRRPFVIAVRGTRRERS